MQELFAFNAIWRCTQLSYEAAIDNIVSMAHPSADPVMNEVFLAVRAGSQRELKTFYLARICDRLIETLKGQVDFMSLFAQGTEADISLLPRADGLAQFDAAPQNLVDVRAEMLNERGLERVDLLGDPVIAQVRSRSQQDRCEHG